MPWKYGRVCWANVLKSASHRKVHYKLDHANLHCLASDRPRSSLQSFSAALAVDSDSSRQNPIILFVRIHVINDGFTLELLRDAYHIELICHQSRWLMNSIPFVGDILEGEQVQIT